MNETKGLKGLRRREIGDGGGKMGLVKETWGGLQLVGVGGEEEWLGYRDLGGWCGGGLGGFGDWI